MPKQGKQFTVAGTDIEEVKRLNKQAGKSYLDVINGLSSGTNSQKVKAEIAEDLAHIPSNQPQLGKTVAGTNIAQVRKQIAEAEQKRK